jgi:hypothetical protein
LNSPFILWSPVPGQPIRSDAAGEGHFGAARGGERWHKGVDYEVEPGMAVRSPCVGRVERFGHCYADEPSYRLIELWAPGYAVVRVLYVQPIEGLQSRDEVKVGEVIGYAQDVSRRYPDSDMRPHVHLELHLARLRVLTGKGRQATEKIWVDPRLFLV